LFINSYDKYLTDALSFDIAKGVGVPNRFSVLKKVRELNPSAKI